MSERRAFHGVIPALAVPFREDYKLGEEGLDTVFALNDPWVIAGLFVGGLMPFLFASLAMQAVGRVGGQVVEEVRRQFRENPGIMEGTTRPDYSNAIGIVTGSLLAKATWGTFWAWEPVQILSVLAWLLYAVLLQTRSVGWRGRRAATLTIVGFALLIVSFLSLNLGLPHGRSFG